MLRLFKNRENHDSLYKPKSKKKTKDRKEFMKAAFILLGLFFIMLTFRNHQQNMLSHSVQKKGALYKDAQ